MNLYTNVQILNVKRLTLYQIHKRMMDEEYFKQLRLKSKEKLKENQLFLQKSIKKMPLKELDKAHNQAFSEIDCMECGNCCKTLGPRFKIPDIKRISKKLKMRESEFIDKYLKVDEDADYVANSLPCPFLGEDNYCFIYEDRPGDCRKYPYTDSDVFFKKPKITLYNTEYCPAVARVMDILKQVK